MRKFTFFCLACFTLQCFSQTGSPDNSFGNGGLVTATYANYGSDGSSVFSLPDGKIVAAGGSGGFIVYKFNNNGTPDVSFDGDGKALLLIGTSGYCTSAAIQSDGKVIVAGSASNGSDGDFAIGRLNADGSPDFSFGTNGKVLTPVGPGHDQIHSVALQSDGKIIAVGQSNNSSPDIALVRYNTNGSLDNTFGSNGILVHALGMNSTDIAYCVAITATGKILIGGTNGSNFALVRYNPDGTIDNSFGNMGVIITDMGGAGDLANSIALQADGKIVLAGSNGNGFLLARYNSDGSPDNSFSYDGKVVTAFVPDLHYGTALALQPDGKILMTGYITFPDPYDANFATLRYNNDGSLDNTFDADGIALTDFGAFDAASAITLQSDGKIIVAGYKTGPSVLDLAMVRYNNTVISGLNGNTGEQSALAFPNPFNTTFKLILKQEKKCSVEVYDAYGKLVQKFSTDNSVTNVNMSGEPKGIYFVTIAGDNEKCCFKVVKE